MKKITFLSQLLFLVVSAQSMMILAHGTKHPTRFLAPDGNNEGDCTDSHNPCASLAYAVELSSKGDKILLASGEYFSSGEDVFYLLSGLVDIEAGYSKDDHYQNQNSTKNTTVFYGVPTEYREKVRKMGFGAVSDTKAKDIKLSAKETKLLNEFQSMNKTSQTFTACNNGLAGNFPCNGIDLQARMTPADLHSSSPSLNDVWGFVDLNDNKEYAIVGLTNGTVIIDVTNPTTPVEIGYISGINSVWRDLKVYQYFDTPNNRYQAYAYVTTEANQGLQIIDLGDLPNSVSLVNTTNDFSTAHNIYIANIDYATGIALEGMTPYIYIAGSDQSRGAFRVYDLTDPSSPTLATSAPTGSGYVHDLTTFNITDSRTAQCAAGHNPCELLVDFNETTVDIWDLTDKAAPFLISSTGYDNASYTHSGWWTEDKMFVFIQDELDEQRWGFNTTLRTLDISDLRAPFVSNVFTGSTKAIDHNGFTVGNKYYMSNYRRGMTVFDITDPNQPSEERYFDTYPSPSANTATFAGAWGVYPFLPSGNILVTDVSYGLFILKASAGSPTPPPTNPPTTPPTTPPASGPVVSSGSMEFIILLVLGFGLRRRFL